MQSVKNKVSAGLLGLAIADALGVPVEFVDRKTLSKKPVQDMRGYGTYDQPAGTWSDDTSMTLCLAESLCLGLDYSDIMQRFHSWISQGEYTPFGVVFDVGNGTRNAINKFIKGTDPLECGGKDEHDNGNGSLMRILPLAFYLHSKYGEDITESDESMDIIHKVSSLTHAHKRSLIACGIYLSIATMLMGTISIDYAIEIGTYRAKEYYIKKEEFKQDLVYYERLFSNRFKETSADQIRSSGYVVDTLEAAIWCLLNTNNYKDCVLKAVNLGEDTDTVGAVAGGLAGLHYGYDGIPDEWLSVLAKKDEIESISKKLDASLNSDSIRSLCAYILYFESATRESAYQYASYDKPILKFMDEVYKSNLLSYDYLEVIKNNGLNTQEKIKAAIETADFELLTAILTGYIRQERFCEGLFASAIEDKTILKILRRFKKFL